jgi:hypothetical protein
MYSETFFKSFSSIVNMFISIFMIHILHSITNSCWEIERNSQIFNEDFYLPLYFPLRCCALGGGGALLCSPSVSVLKFGKTHLQDNSRTSVHTVHIFLLYSTYVFS